MKPPETIDVLDKNGGFTALTPVRHTNSSNTLWRPRFLLKQGSIGNLRSFQQESFYQNNNNVTAARYKVKGYRYPVILWFDNVTGERIA